MIDIKSTSNVPRFSTPINEGSKRKFLLMKEDYITLKFSIGKAIYFKLGDYVDIPNDYTGLFEVCDIQKPTFNNSTGGYDYELRLDAYYWKWKNKKFKFTPETGGQEASWSLTASLDVQLGVFLKNLQALGYKYRGKNFEFSIDGTVENKSIPMNYDSINLLDALSAMAQAWECEWWVTNSVVHFGRCEYGTPVAFELGKNVLEMTRSDSQTNFATRIYAFGSTRNIPTNYRPVDESAVVNGVVQRRLMLPIGTPYIDAYPNMSTEEAVEDVVVFEDVYPRRVGTMSGIHTHEYTDIIKEDGKPDVVKKWNAYRFKDTGITFSEKYALKDQELRIIFQSGVLNGMEFAVTFNPYDKEGGETLIPEKNEDGSWNPAAQVWEIVRNEDYGRPLPDDVLRPQAEHMEGNVLVPADTYVLYGFDTKFVSDTMIPSAEKELKEKAQKYVEKSKIDPSVYDCKMMSEYAYNDGELRIFDIGDRVNLINEAYFETGSRQSRIIGFEYNLDIPWDSPAYTVGESASYSRIGELENKIESLTYKGQTYTGVGGSGVYLITSNDSTQASDRNAYSAKRAKKESLSKTCPDRTDFLMQFFGGTEIKGGLTVDRVLIKSDLNARQLKTVMSQALTEEGGGNEEMLGMSLIEEGDGNPDMMSSSLIEEAAAGAGGGTLGTLDNTDDLFDSCPDDIYYLRKKDGVYYPEVIRSLNLKLFSSVTPISGSIIINNERTPYAKVVLTGEKKILHLSIANTSEGSTGQILVFQTGFKQLSLASNIKGTVDLPLNADTISLLSYNRMGDTIYIYSQTVLGDIQFPTPQRILDMLLVYSDSSVCSVQWSAPWANNIYDKSTAYDMRYSNSFVDADDPAVWAGLKKVDSMPEPASPGTLQRMTITGLTANKEYYIYLKSIKVNFGAEYLSKSSDFVYFKTIGSQDTSKAFRINLTERNLIPQLRNYLSDTDGTVCSIDKMIDERDKNIFLEDGYPDTKNKDYTTFWTTYKYGRDTSPFHIIIDLFSVYAVDKLFVYSRFKPFFSVWGMKDFGYEWVRVGEIKIGFNEWKSLDFKDFQCRFIKIAFDLMDFGGSSTNPVMVEGSEGFPDPEYNGSIERIDNLLLYGRPVSLVPDGIMPPLRRATARKTVDQFFCTNGHAYQQGRIHSKCSGEQMRMYIHFGQFAANYNTPDSYTRLADMRFKVSQIGWVSSNNGTGDSLEDLLRNSYKRYGLKPYLCNTGVFDYCYYDRGKSVHNRPCDGYWYPGAWRPVPQRGIGGLDKYFAVTMNPLSYKTYAKLCFALAAKYGNKQVDGTGLFYPTSEALATGLNLISGIEPENEPDQNWSGWIGYSHAEEYAAVLSASSDGHLGEITDEDNRVLPGIKGGDILSIGSGTASVNRGYVQPALLHWKTFRKNSSIPVDVFSMHMYFSNIGNQESSKDPVQYGITFEESSKNSTGSELLRMIEFRDRFAPDKEIALTEFGWGESGGRLTASKYQCYTQPGRQIGDWAIPDRHRSDVKGSWIVRACVQMMRIGVDFANYYSTECEGNFFGAGVWDSGSGFEMFKWNECTDATPGAKAEAIKKYEHGFARGGFATTGLFGQLLGNGAYPITRAYWWVATMRNRLKGYVYSGMKYLPDNRIVVACFKKQDEDKGAYLVYLNDNINTGVPGVEIPVPNGVSQVRHVTVHVPEICNPDDVDNRQGNDRERTGLSCARHERYENGQWKLSHQPFYKNRYSSYAKGAATYPTDPKEGDEVVVLPTAEENPYFPIVGPVSAKRSSRGNTLSAQQYETDREDWQDEPQVDSEGNVIWMVKSDIRMAWRQVDAVCDYIDYHPQGIRGSLGDESMKPVIRGMIQTNVSEFPEYYFFDAIPEADYKSEVTDFLSRTISHSAIELYWNNTNTEDTGYELFVSNLPETGYRLLKEIGIGIENKALVSGLSPNTTYYYKLRPLRGRLLGVMSDYTSVRTFSELPAVTNLAVGARSATSITLVWDYLSSQVADFVYYAIYRADQTGGFVQVGKVEDQTVHLFKDAALAVGRTYKYKVRAVGLNGQSDYTSELETRTLLAQECSPVVQRGITDKIGTKVILVFDLKIGLLNADAKSRFSLTEDGNARAIISLAVDSANPTNLILSISSGSLSEYDQKRDIRVTYTGGGAQSEYGVPLDAFSNLHVANLIGNFTNIEAIYKVNLTKEDASLPPEEWNNLIGNPEVSTVSSVLTDTYGRASEIVLSSVQNKPKFSWGHPVDSGSCGIEGIEPEVFKSCWVGPNFGSNNTENMIARLLLSNLKNENRYTIKCFGATMYGQDIFARIKINGVYSNVVSQKGNKTEYMLIEDCQSSGGDIQIDVINAAQAGASTSYPLLSFMIIEEYKSDDAPENTDVYLRAATIAQAVDEVVKSADVTVHLNCIGTATAFRISERAEMTEVEWVDIMDNNFDVPYTLSAGFGPKVLYVQVKNLSSESNIRTINVEYRDPYIPLVLKNIYVNDDDSSTYHTSVEIMIERSGAPTHYRVAESPDLSGVEWIAWSVGESSQVDYALSPDAGQKTVYVQLKDRIGESAIKVDMITLIVLQYEKVTLDIDIAAAPDKAALTVDFAPLKYDKSFAYGITSDDTHVSAWNLIFKYFNGMWIDDAIYFHKYDVDGQLSRRTTGAYAPRALTYTDGCGTLRRFEVNTANFYNLSARHLEDRGGERFPYLLWAELEEMLDFDCGISLHDVKAPNSTENGGTIEHIVLGINDANRVIQERIGRKCMVMTEPNGDSKYTAASELVRDIRMITRQHRADLGFDWVNLTDKSLNVEKLKMGRMFNESPVNGAETWKQGFLSDYNNQWGWYGEFGCHGADKNKDIDPSKKNWPHLTAYFDWLCDTYGEHGNDSIWFATNEEVIQYKVLCRMSAIEYTLEGDVMHVTLNVPVLEDFNWSELTLLVSGLPRGSVSESGNVKGLSYGFTNEKYMINVNLDHTIETRADKYVSLFESGYEVDDKVSAEYFIQRLKPSLRTEYRSRIEAATQPPVLYEFGIRATTEQGTDTPDIVFHYSTNNRATHYMVSESPVFEGAEWLFVGRPDESFVLNNVAGDHTVYFKVKNQFGESAVKNDTIRYAPVALGLTSVTLNQGAATTSNSVVVVGFICVGSPTHYMVSENAAFTGAVWSAYREVDIQYTLSSGLGNKTVYLKLKDIHTQTDAKSDTIELVTREPVKTIVSFSGEPKVVSYPKVNEKIINVVASNKHESYSNLQLKDSSGNNSGYFLCKPSLYPAGTVGLVDNLFAPTLDDSGSYPAVYLKKYLTVTSIATEESPILLRFASFDPGTYTVRILSSGGVGISIASDKWNSVFYSANLAHSNLTYDMVDNKDKFVEIENVVVENDRVLDIKAWLTINMNYRPGFNLIEIIKK